MKEETNTAEAEVSPNETTAAAAVPVIGDNTPAETSAPAVSEISLAAETDAPVDEAKPVSASEEAYTEQETSLSEAETEIATTETETTVSESEQETTVSEAEQETTVPETEAVTTVPETVQETAFTTVPETEITTVPSAIAPQYVPSPYTGTTPSAAETTTTVTTEETSETTTETTEPLPTTYTISFETSEEGVTMPESITAEEGETVTLPAVPEKTGYTGKWTLDGGAIPDGYVITSDITITAVYAINSYTITYDTNMEGLNLSPAVSYFQYGKNLKASLPDLPEVEGYTGEWQINGKAVPDGYTVSEDITVTAFYTINTYTITFETSETDVAMPESVTKDYGTEYTLPDVPEKTGHDGHWEIDGEEVTSVTVDGDITVTAVYTVQKYPVKLVFLDGDRNDLTENIQGYIPEDIEFEYGSLISEDLDNLKELLPEIPGYSFDYWLYNGDQYSYDAAVDVPGENGIAVTAVYYKTGYVVTYHHLKDSTDTETQIVPFDETYLNMEYESATGIWVYEDEEGIYRELNDGSKIDSDLDLFEGITLCIDEIYWWKTDSTSVATLNRGGYEFAKKYGDPMTKVDIDEIKDTFDSKYYAVYDSLSDISQYPNTDEVLTDSELSSIDTTKNSYIIPALRFNYSGKVYNYFSVTSSSNWSYELFFGDLRTLSEGEAWCIGSNGSTVKQDLYFKDSTEFTDVISEIGFNTEPLTLSIKNVVKITFIDKWEVNSQQYSSETTPVYLETGNRFVSNIPDVKYGTKWVYRNENGGYSEFTADTEVTESMEVYNGVKLHIMRGKDQDYYESEIVYAKAYDSLFGYVNFLTYCTDQKVTPEHNYGFDLGYISINEGDVGTEDMTIYEVTNTIEAKDRDGNITTYYMNSGYDSEPLNWLPQANEGYEWKETKSVSNNKYSYEEVSDGTGISLDFSLPITAIPDSEDDPEAKINTDAAEPSKPEDIPEPTETPDDTGTGE